MAQLTNNPSSTDPEYRESTDGASDIRSTEQRPRSDGNSGASHPLTRREVLAAGGAVSLAGLAGCLDAVDDLVNQASATGFTTTSATPASFYGGSDASQPGERPGRQTVRATDLTYVPVSVRSEETGRSRDIELDGWFVDAIVRAQNHNASRSNRTTGVARHNPDGSSEATSRDSDSDDLSAADEALYTYLDGDAVIGERCVLALPDARARDSNKTLGAHITPERLLEYLTTDPRSSDRPTDDDGSVYAWGQSHPRFAAEISVPEWDRYDPWAQLVALGYNGDVNNATIRNVPDYASAPAEDEDSDNGDVEAMRRSIESKFARERSKLGAMVYDGELGEEALAFLPTKLRSGPGLRDLIDRTVADLGDRQKNVSIPLRGESSVSATQTLQTTIVALDAPVVHLAQDGCEEPPYCANQIPATNTIPSR